MTSESRTQPEKSSSWTAPAPAPTQTIFTDDALDPVYQAKAQILNEAIQDIGMGRYQWGLFVVAGFGWLADNLWPVVTGLILAPVVNEFDFNGPFLKLGQNIGLLVGAVFWGVGSDIWGRKISFNITLLLTAIFALAGGGSPNFVALSSFAAVWSIGVGGNLPVDSAIFLEFIPASHQYLLTVLSIWWALGQLLASLVAWPLIGNYSCALTTPPNCPRSANQGWRYFLFAMGGLMFVLWGIRFFIFKLYESPKYLMGRGQDELAVEVVHRVAQYNGTTSRLVLEDLAKAGDLEFNNGKEMDTSARAAVARNLASFDAGHVKSLFATRKLAYSTTLLIILWGTVPVLVTVPLSLIVSPLAFIGLAFPLYNSFVTYYLATRGADFGDGSLYITYRNLFSLDTWWNYQYSGDVELLHYPLASRSLLSFTSPADRFELALTGVFILVSTTARTSNALLGWNCAYSFTSNVMYGVLYAITPELFPTKDRGTGNAIVAAANRVFGVMGV
ncbi:hypothetical protein H0H93_004519 [Arthromyces matolae]|nr:hypothetical protein H0H93_004519 [Arthromyces matolae]